MKKFYLLLFWVLFATSYMSAQYTETFEGATTNALSFTGNGKTFNLSTTAIKFSVVSFTNLGYAGSSKFIQVSDTYSQIGTISTTGSYRLNSLYIYLTGNATQQQNVTSNGNPGSVTFRGKLGGVTQFTVVKTNTSGNIGTTPTLPENGFVLVNFANEGGNNNSNTLIDQLDIELSANYDYFAIDNFAWTANTSPTITTSGTLNNFTACAGTNSAEQSFTASGVNLTGNITITAPTGYELSTVSGGTFSGTLNLTQSGGNVANTTIYVRTTSGATGNPGGNITLASASASPATVFVAANVSALPAITGQPSNSSICEGANTTFSATASGTTSYIWQVNTGSGFVNITNGGVYSGATTATLAITGATLGMNGNQYRLLASGACSPSAISNNVTLTVNGGPSITSHPSTSTICAGANTTFSVAASNATGYQWQQNSGSGYFNITNGGIFSGATTSTLTVTGATAGMNGYTYRVTVSSPCTFTAVSNLATLTVNSAPAITSQPSASAICAGANTTFSVAASNATGYQWQVDQGAGYANVTNGGVYSGATTATLTITGATAGINGYVYRAVSSGSCTPNATSNAASLTINSAPAVTSQPSSASISAGTNTTFSVVASNATGYQWQVDQGAGYSNVSDGGVYSGATTATLTITAATAGMNNYSYRVIMTGNCTPAKVSNAVSLTVNSNPVITGNPPNRTLCPGFNTTFPVTATGATSYQWQVNTGSGFVDVTNGGVYSNATTSTLTLTGVTVGMSGYQYRCVVTNASGSTNSNSSTLTVPNIVVTTTAQTNVSCNGGTNGSATVTATGGIAPYTYSWSPSGVTGATATGLAPGTYTVTVTDNITCTKNHTVTITQPATPVSGTTITTNVTCNGGANGTIDLSPAGGTPGYTYNWGGGITTQDRIGLTAGSYSCVITDANGCTATVTGIVITQPTAVSGSTVVTNVSCNSGTNGTINLTPTGGTGPYTFNWGGGITTEDRTGLAAGNYAVTITDANGCTGTVTGITVTQPSVISGSTVVTNIACNGGNTGSINLTPTGGTPGYTFNWGGGITTEDRTGLSAGTYTVIITDANSCTRTITSTVTQPSTALSGTTVVTNVSCNGGTNGAINLTPTGGTGPYTFNWGGGITTEDRTGLAAGTYSVTITDFYGCTAIVPATITQPTATVSGTTVVTNIACNGGNSGAINLTPTGGTGPYTFNWGGGITTEDRTGLIAGTYSVTITDNNGCTGTVSGITVTQPTAIASSVSAQTNVPCSGGATGSATVSATGGAGSYTYSWAPSGGTAATATGLAAGTYTLTITDANGCTKTQTVTIIQAPAPSGTATVTNVSCNGGANGTATVTASGGTSPYTYLWSNGANTATASGLSAGTYSVTITDASSCTGTLSGIVVTQPAALVASQGTINNVSCNGGSNGSATVIATGGTGSKTYSWSPTGGTGATASGLAAGTYTVTVTDANFCQATQSFTITEPTPFGITTAQTDILCNGAATGSASVTVTGGTGAYTYSWSPSGGTAATATGLTAGTFTITVKDANLCQTTRTFTIVQPSTLVATPVSITNIACRGNSTGSATVNVTGGTGAYTYSWSPSGGTAATASGLAAGTYTVTVKDANLCQTTQVFTLTQPAAILSATTASTGVSCFGGSNGTASVTVSGGTPGYAYVWAPLGGTTSTITGRPAGNYTCTITDANGCTLVKNITINTPAAFSATISKTDVSCNGGTNGTASVTTSGATAPYSYSWSPSGGTGATATGLAAGNYTVTITDANTCQTTASITLNQPNAISVTPSQTNVLCNGGATGAASVTATGGTPGYTYVWSPAGGTASTATGLAAGNYSVIVTDANGCTFTQNYSITQPTVLSATTAQINATCVSPGQASVTPSGGTTPYTYLWINGATTQTVTGLVAGNYNVLITDGNGCTLVKHFTITTTNTLVATTSQTDVLCKGTATGTATVVPSGAPGPFTYVWTPSGGNAATATGLTAGNYSVTITSANGCSTVKNFTITEPATALVATSGTINNTSCNGGANGSATVIATGGTGAYTYTWSPSGGTAATASGLAAGTYTVTVKDANLCQTTQVFTITQPTAITSSVSAQTNVNCNGGTNGSATVTAAGGTGAYTYVWLPSGGTAATASGLAAGTYTVTIKDANLCQITQTVTISQPVILAATGAKTDVSCFGGTNGTATVTATGGTAPYTYAWSPSGGTAATTTGRSAGTYTVTVTDSKGCTTTASVTIAQPAAALAATAVKTDASCFSGSNGTTTVTATGGTAPYTYAWAPSGGTANTASGLTAGTYTVTVTDSKGCTTTATATVAQPTAIAATTAKTDVSCFGGTNGTATVTATGGTGAYTYVWSPSGGTAATASGLAAGTYTVTIKDANLCQVTQTVTIAQPAAALVATTAKTDVSCFSGSNGSATVTATGGTAPYTYSWAPSGGTAATASGLAAGTYTVTVTDSKGCTTTASATVIQPAAALATTAGTQVNLVCNGAATGSASVNVTGGTAPYSYAWSPSGGTAATASGLTAGTYTVTVTDSKGCTATRQFTLTQPTAITATSVQTNILCNGGNNGSATVTATGGTGTTYTYSWSPSGGTSATATGLTAGAYTVTITDSAGCTGTKVVTITQPNVLVANATTSNISCNGAATGSATITPVGGTAPFSYVWTPAVSTTATATGLAVGNYSVVVTDANGCTASRAFTITQQAALVVVPSHTNVTCNGSADGTASVAVSGGSQAYFYQWAPTGGTAATATGLAAGNYTVTITDMAGCVNIQSFVITQPNSIAVTVDQTNILCGGTATGAIDLDVTGGTGIYTYAWVPNVSTTSTASGLVAGNYSVTITDTNGCSTLRNFSLTQPQPLVNTIATTNALCFGATGSASVVSTGGAAPYTYQWMPAGGTAATATDLLAGVYTLTTTDANGCIKMETVTIAQPQGVNITTQPQTANVTVNTTATFTTVAGNTTGYQWQVSTDGTTWANVTDGGTNPAYSGSTTNSLTVANIPVSFDGYLYRVQFSQTGNCFTNSFVAALNVSNVLTAVDDDFSANIILEGTGGIAGDVTANDLFNNTSINDSDVTISVVNAGGLVGVSIDGNGNINVPASTPDATYTVVYKICDVLNDNNCSNASVTIVVSPVNRIEDFANTNISVYPNPASTQVFVKIPQYASYHNLKANLYDLNGRLVRDANIADENFSMDVSGLESAIYILNVTSDSGVITKRIAVTKKF